MSPNRPSQSRRAPAGEPDWLTLGQAAKFLGVAQSTIRKWSDLGRVPAFYTPGGHRRYRRGDLESFIDRSGPGSRGAGPLVLVVDDDPRLRELVRVNLELEGYEVLEAGSLAEARAALANREASLVLLDMHIGNERGHALLDELAGHDPPIPVAVVTGSVDLDAGDRVHADAVLAKPFTIEALVETVRSLAATRAARS